MSIATKVVVTGPDGNLFYRQEHEWAAATPGMQDAITKGLEKQLKFLADLDANKKKGAVSFKAVFSMAGQPDLVYDDFTFDEYQKAHHSWNQVTDELLREQEKHIPKGGGKP